MQGLNLAGTRFWMAGLNTYRLLPSLCQSVEWRLFALNRAIFLLAPLRPAMFP
jgi:hypothetical protein